MTTIHSFINRLDKIGIKVELFSNYPWVYLDKVNSKVVDSLSEWSDHGFCICIRPITPDRNTSWYNLSQTFKEIRRVLDKDYKSTKVTINV